MLSDGPAPQSIPFASRVRCLVALARIGVEPLSGRDCWPQGQPRTPPYSQSGRHERVSLGSGCPTLLSKGEQPPRRCFSRDAGSGAGPTARRRTPGPRRGCRSKARAWRGPLPAGGLRQERVCGERRCDAVGAPFRPPWSRAGGGEAWSGCGSSVIAARGAPWSCRAGGSGGRRRRDLARGRHRRYGQRRAAGVGRSDPTVAGARSHPPAQSRRPVVGASPASLVVLDRGVAAELAAWPEIMACLLDRLTERSERLAITQAISQLTGVDRRLLTLFWHLAERWGRVGTDGVVVPLAPDAPHARTARRRTPPDGLQRDASATSSCADLMARGCCAAIRRRRRRRSRARRDSP